jgi:hypothetical protein
VTVHVGRLLQVLYQPILQRDHLVKVGQRVAAELEHELVAHITANQ